MEMTTRDDRQSEDAVELLRLVYPCIGTAISHELEHGNYQEIERLKELRRKIEKMIA